MQWLFTPSAIIEGKMSSNFSVTEIYLLSTENRVSVYLCMPNKITSITIYFRARKLQQIWIRNSNREHNFDELNTLILRLLLYKCKLLTNCANYTKLNCQQYWGWANWNRKKTPYLAIRYSHIHGEQFFIRLRYNNNVPVKQILPAETFDTYPKNEWNQVMLF